MGVYYTYAFTYNSDSPVRHLTSHHQLHRDRRALQLHFYNTGQYVAYDPFLNNTHGTTAFLSRATISNIGTYYQFTTDSSGELTQIQLPYKGYLAYAYTTTTYGNGRSFRELNNRYLSKDGKDADHLRDQPRVVRPATTCTNLLLSKILAASAKVLGLQRQRDSYGLASTYQGRDRFAGGPSNCLSGNTNGARHV